MHCVLNYPTLNENANLGMITDLIKKFPETVPGYSDHTLPYNMDTLKIANLLGAVVLEKHFTHDKSLPGNDHYHAMDKEDLKVFTKQMDDVYELLGLQKKIPLDTEEKSRENARRSLVAKKAIKKGEYITKAHLTWKRPASGISPAHLDVVLGKESIVDIEEDEILKWKMLS